MTESIIKVANKTENFTIVSNEVPRECKISARAKGIYFYLMTLPANWSIHKEEIYTHFTEGRDALDTAWNELVSYGYIEKEIIRENGRITSNSWKVYETSRLTEKPNQVKPVTGFPSDGFPVTGNPQLLNTNKQSTKTLSTKQKTEKAKLPNELYTEIEESYLKNYENLFSKLPVLIYPVIRKKIKTLIDNGITKDQILLAIETAKNDSWIKSTGFEITTILSEKVLPRLINASSQNSSSTPYERRMTTACPACGVSLDQYSVCPVCHHEYDVTGRKIG